MGRDQNSARLYYMTVLGTDPAASVLSGVPEHRPSAVPSLAQSEGHCNSLAPCRFHRETGGSETGTCSPAPPLAELFPTVGPGA